MALFVSLLDFGAVPRVWHYSFFIFILDFGIVRIVWHYCFFYWALEVFRQCDIICFSIGLWNCCNRVVLFVVLLYFGTDLTV
jgi:hypothetical protein